MHKYHVALSFAGEDRDYVDQVATRLRAEGVDVFYDRFEEVDLWGKDLYTHLSDVYQNKALFTLMFVSEAYEKKLWTNHERRSAQARAFSESKEYILPVFFDESIEVPGLLKTTGYISLKGKSPDELAGLIVQKLKKSGVSLKQQFGYSESAKADVDFPLPSGKEISAIVSALRSYTFGTQNPAVVKLLELDWSKVTPDEAFVLGRNLYQTACGGEFRAEAVLTNLRRELAKLPEDRALDLVNGMFFEVYFDSAGEFRGSELKKRHLPRLLALQTVEKYSASVSFIRRALAPYKDDLIFLPNISPQSVSVEVSVKKTDPPTVKSIQVDGKNVLKADPEHVVAFDRMWRLSYESFTIKSLREKLSREWGIPEHQLNITCKPKVDAKTRFRLPEGSSIYSPLKN